MAAARPWKHVVLVAGVAGVFGLFLPFVEIRHRVTWRESAKDLSFGLERTHGLVDRRLPALAERALPKLAPSKYASARQDVGMALDAARYAALAFVPAGVLGLLGVAGLVRRRFGRWAGGVAFVAGSVSIAAWFALRYAIGYGLAEADLPRSTVSMQLGAHLLLAIGGLGVIAGVGALARPDRVVRA